MLPFNVYLASHYERREELCKYRDDLQARGLTVTSRWLDGEQDWSKWVDGTYGRWDLEDIDKSHVLVAFTDDQPHTRGGLQTEIGYALALDARRVFIVGPRINVFTQMLGENRVFAWPYTCFSIIESIRYNWNQIGRMFPVLRPSNPISMYDIYTDTYARGMEYDSVIPLLNSD